MSSPALSVTSESFLPILKKLDECITFMQENVSCPFVYVSLEWHDWVRWFTSQGYLFQTIYSGVLICYAFYLFHMQPQCKESQVYLARFQQFQSRALNLIRGHVTQVFLTTTQSLQQPAVAVTPEQAPGEEVWDSTYSLYYGKFRSGAPKVKVRLTSSNLCVPRPLCTLFEMLNN